jgi:hypothetical protein
MESVPEQRLEHLRIDPLRDEGIDLPASLESFPGRVPAQQSVDEHETPGAGGALPQLEAELEPVSVILAEGRDDGDRLDRVEPGEGFFGGVEGDRLEGQAELSLELFAAPGIRIDDEQRISLHGNLREWIHSPKATTV